MAKFDPSRTIVAVSSGIAPAHRAIVRISGSETRSMLQLLLHPCVGDQLASATSPQRLETTAQVAMHDRSLAVPVACHWWPTRRSFTGEPSAELHLVGSLPLVELLVEQVLRLGARPAERGEFTLRSFLAGNIDLTQAEAILGVIEAHDPHELELALGQLGGNISKPVQHLRNRLIELTAHLEAGLDFVEEDIEFITSSDLIAQLSAIRDALRQLAARLVSRGSRERQPTVVLIGLPNAGKSTLFNLLLGESRAIVSAQAGTTRDAISASVHFGDLPVELVDTAGIEELSEASPRGLAQSMLRSRLEAADLVVFCLAMDRTVEAEWLAAQLQALPSSVPRLLVGTKCLSAIPSAPQVEVRVDQTDPSTIETLKRELGVRLAQSTAELHSSAMHTTLMRCRDGILRAEDSLQQAIDAASMELGEELVAAELRLTLDELGTVIGEVHTEDILGQIFSRFCIGK